MFDNKARQQLESLLSDLHNWEGSVASRAEGFHRLRRLLQGDIEAELKRLFPRKSLAESYYQRYRPLAKLASDLAGLLGQSQELEGELDELQRLFSNERELSTFGENTCRRWREELRKLPVQCERETDLSLVGQNIEQIDQSIRLYTEALRTCQEADAIVRRLGSSDDTVAVEIELLRLRQTMASGPVPLDGARQIKRLCVPLEALLNRPEPRELQSLAGILTEIRDWNRSLDAPTDQERSLEQRRRQLGTDWRRRDSDVWQTLLQEAEDLRRQLADQGKSLRDSKLAELEELLDDLVYSLNLNQQETQDIQDIRHRLDSLKQGGWDSVHRHKDWLEKFKETDALFKAITSDQEPALEKRLRERCVELNIQLRQLQDMPMADGLRRQAEALEQEVGQFCQPYEAHDVLRDLRQSHEISRQVVELDRQVRLDRLELDDRQRDLREDNGRLLAEAARIGLAVEDLAPAIEALVAGAANRTLDQARELARSLTQQLDGNRQALLRHCQAAQNKLLEEITLYVAALCVAGFPAAASDQPDGPVALEAFPDRLTALAQERQTLEQQIDQAITALERHRERQWADLSLLVQQGLPPGEREEAEALLSLTQINAPLASTQANERLERLRRLAEATEAGRSFLERLSAEQQSWQEQLAVFKDRLQAFNQERLKLHCPEELLNRVADLAYGIPVPLSQQNLLQLREAKTLFDRIEQQALRLTAQIVDGQLAELEQRKHSHPKPKATVALLADIHNLGDDVPVPVNLRQRLQNAVAVLDIGRTHGRT